MGVSGSVALATIAVKAADLGSQPLQLEPSSPWNLNYSDNSCQLIRKFGSGDRAVTMVLERISPDADLSLLLFGPGLRSRAGDSRVTAVLTPFTANPFKLGSTAIKADTKELAVYWPAITLRSSPAPQGPLSGNATNRLPRDPARQEMEDRATAAITALEIVERGRLRTVFPLRKFAAANAMMRDCARDQLETWGVDAKLEAQIRLPATPKKPLASLIRHNDYPEQAIRNNAESVIKVRLLVDAAGKVSRCTTLTNFKEPGFAEVVCARMKTAAFFPAELADGTKVPSYLVTFIRFVIPDL